MPVNDEQRWSSLMVSAQTGSESDYQQLLKELAVVIHNFLRNRFGNHYFIEDCVQESLIAVHQARHTYDAARPFRPWLFAIVRNKAIDYLRRRSSREKTVQHFQREQEILAQPGRQGFSRSEITGGRLLELLPDRYKEPLVLTKIIGFSVAETAEKLEISESAVKVRVYRAIRKLRQMLEEDE